MRLDKSINSQADADLNGGHESAYAEILEAFTTQIKILYNVNDGKSIWSTRGKADESESRRRAKD